MAWRLFFFFSGTWRNGRHVPLGLIIFLLFNKYRGMQGVLENDSTSHSPCTSFRCPSFRTLQRDPKHTRQWIDGICETFHYANMSLILLALVSEEFSLGERSTGSIDAHQILLVSTERRRNCKDLTHASRWTPGAELPEVAEHDEREKGRRRVREGAAVSVLLFDRMRVTGSRAQPEARRGLRHLFVFLLIRAPSF